MSNPSLSERSRGPGMLGFLGLFGFLGIQNPAFFRFFAFFLKARPLVLMSDPET